MFVGYQEGKLGSTCLPSMQRCRKCYEVSEANWQGPQQGSGQSLKEDQA